MTMQIRNANVGDAEVLCEAEKFYAATPGFLVSKPHELNKEMFVKKISDLATSGGIYIVAEEHGSLLGHAFLEAGGIESVAHNYRLTIAVHPNKTSQGVGKALMTHLVNWARQNPKVLKLELLVRAPNTRAISLYEKMGFKEEGRLIKRIRISETEFIDDILMGLWVE